MILSLLKKIIFSFHEKNKKVFYEKFLEPLKKKYVKPYLLCSRTWQKPSSACG